MKPVMLCAPVDKNGEGIGDPVSHLTCYELEKLKVKATLDVDRHRWWSDGNDHEGGHGILPKSEAGTAGSAGDGGRRGRCRYRGRSDDRSAIA